MTNKTLLIPAIGLAAILTSPASAQDEEKADVIAPPPPTLYIPPPSTPIQARPPRDKSSAPRPVSFDSIRPKPADYPPAAWLAKDEGTVEYEVAVSAEGEPEACKILSPSGSDALDTKTCDIVMERGQFEPARNESGEAIPGTYRNYQTWSRRQPQFGPGTVIDVVFTVTAEGNIEDCKVNEMSGDLSDRTRKNFEQEPCPGMNSPGRPVYRDESGNPVTKRVNLKVTVDVEDILE